MTKDPTKLASKKTQIKINQRWKESEVQTLYGPESIEDLSKKLNRSYDSIRRKFEELRIPKKGRQCICPIKLQEIRTRWNNNFHSPFPIGPTIDPKLEDLWDQLEEEHLQHYWKLSALGTLDIAQLLNREIEDVIQKAKTIGLPENQTISHKFRTTNGRWREDLDPSNLEDFSQHELAEATATRLAHLHQKERNKQIEREIEDLLNIQKEIYARCISSQINRLTQGQRTPKTLQDELRQVGITAVYTVAIRWKPEPDKNYSRDCIGRNIKREMREWMEKHRTIRLPEKVNQDARKLQRAALLGTTDEYIQELKDKNHTERYIQNLKKHQDTWHPFHCQGQLSDDYEEEHTGAFQAEMGDPSQERKAYCEFDPEYEAQDIRKYLHEILDQIPIKEGNAIRKYYGIHEEGEALSGKTLEIIGREDKVTRERIRQRINSGKKKMKKILFQVGVEKSYHLLKEGLAL